MLDIKYIRENIEETEKLIASKGTKISFDEVLRLDEKRREVIKRLEDVKRVMNEESVLMARLKKEGKLDEFKEKTIVLKEKSSYIKEQDAILKEIEAEIREKLSFIPNIPSNSTPKGKSEDDNVVVKECGQISKFDFKAKDHMDIGESLDIIDMKRASIISGARFPLLKGMGAMLEMALINFMLDVHREQGYVDIVPPILVNKDSLFGTGQLPKFEEDLFACKDDEYYLVPTAEVPLINIHRDEIVSLDSLPIKYMAYTPCFRREAGSYGKDTRGLIRNHQFNKIELVKFTKSENSYIELESLLLDAAKVLDMLDIPYRIVELSTFDLSFASSKTYDIELWMPGEERYREVSSCSNCSDFQARRLNIRYKDENKKTQLTHTLNASGIAVGRTFAAVLENYQTKDGYVKIPEKLIPYMKGIDVIK